jgi:hypothetical protein
MSNRNLDEYSTKELVSELTNREAVELVMVQPHEEFQISTKTINMKDTGPVNVIIVSD